MKKLLQAIAKTLRFIAPITSFTGILIITQQMATYPIGSFLFWTCLILAASAVVSAYVGMRGWVQVDWLYAHYATFVEHEVFREGQLPMRASLRATILGAGLAIFATWIYKPALPALFYAVALPLGLISLVCLVLLGLACIRMALVAWSCRDHYVAYAYKTFDAKTGEEREIQETCHIADVKDVLTLASLDYVLAKRKYGLGSNDDLMRAVVHAYAKASKSSAQDSADV